MVKIQFDLTEKEDDKIRKFVYKNKSKNKAEAIKEIIKEYKF